MGDIGNRTNWNGLFVQVVRRHKVKQHRKGIQFPGTALPAPLDNLASFAENADFQALSISWGLSFQALG